jgi:hypothetical protein
MRPETHPETQETLRRRKRIRKRLRQNSPETRLLPYFIHFKKIIETQETLFDWERGIRATPRIHSRAHSRNLAASAPSLPLSTSNLASPASPTESE